MTKAKTHKPEENGTETEVKSPLFDVKKVCPVCGVTFKSKRVKTASVRTESRDTDFYTKYKGEDPTWYAVLVCPNCGYSGFDSGYEDITEPQKNLIMDNISVKWKQRDFGGPRTVDDALGAHMLALACYQVMGVKKSLLGKLCLRIAWLYRTKGDPKENAFMEFAAKNWEEAYTTEHMSEDKENEIMIMFLLGELNRRLGRLQEASRWMAKALDEPELKKKRHMEMKVRDQMSQIREDFVKAKKKNQE